MPIDSTVARLLTSLHLGERAFHSAHDNMTREKAVVAFPKAFTDPSFLAERVANTSAV
jgi:hypothetical protein